MDTVHGKDDLECRVSLQKMWRAISLEREGKNWAYVTAIRPLESGIIQTNTHTAKKRIFHGIMASTLSTTLRYKDRYLSKKFPRAISLALEPNAFEHLRGFRQQLVGSPDISYSQMCRG